uniref:Uncharacterized protein n=1 Tax=Pararge aegeria TaxID=116150 RepID=S4P6H5_9NEOP
MFWYGRRLIVTTNKDVPPSDLVLVRCREKPIRSMAYNCNTPSRLVRYHLRWHHNLPSGEIVVKGVFVVE